MSVMTDTDSDLLTDVERLLKEQFQGKTTQSRVQSTALDPSGSARLDQLVLPLEKRAKMPYTQDKYIVRENPQKVAWERVARQFLRQLSPRHSHRVSAAMIYEWATGISLKEFIEQGGTPSPDLRKLNEILRHYFGQSYSTYIMGRKVPRCYRVREGYKIKYHRPLTLELLAEYHAKTLNP